MVVPEEHLPLRLAIRGRRLPLTTGPAIRGHLADDARFHVAFFETCRRSADKIARTQDAL
jgi:hypothetical protein